MIKLGFKNFKKVTQLHCLNIQIRSPRQKSETEKLKLVALVESSVKLGWNEMLHMDMVDPTFHEREVLEPDFKEKYTLNAGLTGIVIEKAMIKNVSGKNDHTSD